MFLILAGGGGGGGVGIVFFAWGRGVGLRGAWGGLWGVLGYRGVQPLGLRVEGAPGPVGFRVT